MNIPPLLQVTGDICTGLAAIVFLFPLRHLLSDYARRYVQDDRWVTPALLLGIPLWLLLMVALLCVTASGGFDWVRLGRPALHTLTVGATLSLGVVWFLFVGLYIRPGFTPRSLYYPFLCLVPLATGLLVLSSLNPRLAPGLPMQWLRWPWTVLAGASLVGCILFFGSRLLSAGCRGLTDFADRCLSARDATPDHLAKIAALDPRQDFTELLSYGAQYRSRTVREAATARLRSREDFIDALVAVLNSRSPESGLEFLPNAALATDEQKRLALPARTALEHFIDDIPAPNFMASNRRKQLLEWGRKTFPLVTARFSGTDVDFSQLLPKLEYALRPDDSRR